MWNYGIDGDAEHPDWEYTLDGDYRPKGCTYTLDGDLVLPNGQRTTQEQLDRVRKGAL